jgi:hypothetical protein
MLLLQKISKELPDITWAANNGLIVSSIDKDMLDSFEQSNCVGFKVGLESGNEEILRAVKKPATLRKFMSFSRLAQNYPSIFVSVNIILGLPNESFGQMLDSLMISIKSKLDWINFYLYQPLKNTESYTVFGGLADQSVELSHGKDNIGPIQPNDNGKKGAANVNNPVRGGAFNHYNNPGEVKSGYDIFNHNPDEIPSRQELTEIWFTFNTLANFILPVERIKQNPIRLNNSIKFLQSLSEAYPLDMSIKCLLIYFLSNDIKSSRTLINTLKKESERILATSEYWALRDSQFNFSSFLDCKIPKLPDKIHNLIANTRLGL